MIVEKDEIKMLKNDEMLKVKKKEGKKVFTNEERNIIINSKYNLLNKDNKNLYERGGLFMKETKDVILSEIMKQLDWKGKIVGRLFPETLIKVYNISRIKTINKIIR